MSPEDKMGQGMRNQIDYILMNRRFRNSCVLIKTYPSADIASDHNPPVATLELKLKKGNKTVCKSSFDTNKLKDIDTKIRVQSELNQEFRCWVRTGKAGTDVDRLTGISHYLGKKYLRPERRIGRRPWMIEEILEKMEDRRMAKKDLQRYK